MGGVFDAQEVVAVDSTVNGVLQGSVVVGDNVPGDGCLDLLEEGVVEFGIDGGGSSNLIFGPLPDAVGFVTAAGVEGRLGLGERRGQIYADGNEDGGTQGSDVDC
jgi:hypothetical protein